MQEQYKCVFNSSQEWTIKGSFDQKVEYHGISMIYIYIYDILIYILVEYMAIYGTYIYIYVYMCATETPPGRDDGRHYRAKVRWMDGESFFFFAVTAT